MKLYAMIISDTGKKVGVAGNEYLDIDITVGNKVIAQFTIKEGEDGKPTVFNADDDDIGVYVLTNR